MGSDIYIVQMTSRTPYSLKAMSLKMAPFEEGMATHTSILAWKISWTQEPGGLQSKGLQRVRHD